ncbi:PREDICTED: coiled-coil domain-containing protein 124-like [Priapulus caudatus]|uniref:Coiled-coil domain-containing protein 124-like n=1 Tax=Priapulus caudatus TaxID=37621 RepID=A0ABM1EDJ3_PRICU|nr:PREDICTED: coiled-coil domain-containing protein 124-like [Priapulus caudatus]XP_014670265.1 PREDICTED: coiled-coil domain-containing protein 124-like [Priapulus caudatus]
MPKKFKGENSKAAVAKERKQAKLTEEKVKKLQAEDDAYWADDDKHVARKQQRKEDQERKKQEAQQKKLEARQLLEEEDAKLKPTLTTGQYTAKVTRAQIQAHAEKVAMQERLERAKANKEESHIEKPLDENINRLTADGEAARTVAEAIAVLSVNDEPALDKHPERRVKAAYLAFEERRLPELKAENPSMRLSQLKQMLRKEWQKSLENPMNQ